MKELAHAILTNARHYEWSLQGFGLLRLHLSNHCRLHVWDSRFRNHGVSMIHDHLQWGLSSTIVAGVLRNQRYIEHPKGVEFMHQTIKPGYGYYAKSEATVIRLSALAPEMYVPGEVYAQEPAEIHETDADDGTVTFMRKMPTTDESARIFWPVGTEWGSAEPRVATLEEVTEITRRSLEKWFAASPHQAVQR
jgi:hypothetical protein